MPSTILQNGPTTSRGRFELPTLEPLDSLTAGTNIPPPPDSPIEETPPAPSSRPEPEIVSAVSEGAPVNGHANGVSGENSATEYTGRGRTNGGSVPTSPISQHRPSSIRRFLSRKSLHSNYTNGTNTNNSQENLSIGGIRPESPSGFSTVTNKTGSKRRNGSWFRRFLKGEDDDERPTKRTSVVYEEKNAPTGPPPPKLPELNQLKSKVEADDAGSLGADDMFKNIK